MITTTQTYQLLCDSCWLQFDESDNALKLELDAQDAGWSMRGTEALCPECAQDREREEVLNAGARSWGEAVFGAKS